MKEKTLSVCIIFLIFEVVFGGPLVAVSKGEIVQSLFIAVKQESGKSFTNNDLQGKYWFKRLGVHNIEANNLEAETCSGYINFNGAGSLDGPVTCFSSDGTSNTSHINETYTINPDGFIINFSSEFFHISSDNNFAVGSGGFTDQSGIHQGLNTLVKVSDTPSNSSDLDGTWLFRDLEFYNFEENSRGAGACTGSIKINSPNWVADSNCVDSDGTTDTGAHSGTYRVADNTFYFYETGDSDLLFSAYLSGDRNILLFTRGSTSGGSNSLMKGIALKESAKSFTNSDLSGSYFLHFFSFYNFESNTREADSSFGTIVFNGNGNWTATIQDFGSNGTLGSPSSVSGTYSVDPDGSVTFLVTSDTPNVVLTGNISDDNGIIIFNESTSNHIREVNRTIPGIQLLLLGE